jgi:hypothetical protein
MIPKHIQTPGPAGSDRPFQHRLAYILAGATAVEVQALRGDPRLTPDLIERQFTAVAARNLRVRRPAMHIELSWHETQTLPDADLMSAGRRLLDLFGAGAHQAVLCVHRNRPSPHLHILLNRVHPVTSAALSLSHDYRRLEQACRQIEHEKGWPADRGRFDVQLKDDAVHLVPKPAAHWQAKETARAEGRRRGSPAQRRQESGGGLPSLRDLVPVASWQALVTALDAAATWAEAFEACRLRGLQYLRVGSGARIRRIRDGARMMASELGTRFGFRAMCARLGPWPDDGPTQGDTRDGQRTAPVKLAARAAAAMTDLLRALPSDPDLRASPLPANHPSRVALRRNDPSWRQRDALRRPVVDPAHPQAATAPAPHDLTWARQIWMLRGRQRQGKTISPQFVAALAPFDQDILARSDDDLLLPLRSPKRGLIGFMRFLRHRAGGWHATLLPGSIPGFAELGPKDDGTLCALLDPDLLPDMITDLGAHGMTARLITAPHGMSDAAWITALSTVKGDWCRIIVHKDRAEHWRTLIAEHLPRFAVIAQTAPDHEAEPEPPEGH